SSAWLAITVFKPLFKSPRSLGMGLISEGGLAVAITLEFYLLNPSLANTLISIIIISILVNELLSPRLILAQFPEAEKL
ncbi:MAG: hypothetical protein ABIK68_19420, partial [bacterium]